MRPFPVLWSLATIAFALTNHASQEASKCTSFAPSAVLASYDASFLNTTHFPIGALNVSGILNHVSFCEIYANISYETNSSLIFAIWLPDTQYALRFMAVGNGGMAGAIDYSNMVTQLNSELGFAVAGGNAGHLASENNAGAGAPEVYLPYLHDEDQVRAWIHDAVSLFTPAAKAVVKHYYSHEAKHAYYDGCSTGGAQGFALAEFHPDLFDGIVAGCPGNWYSHLALSFLWSAQQTDTNATFLSQPVLDFITAEALRECDLIDGVADNLIENPLACPFDVSSLACNGSILTPNDNITCLISSHITAAKAINQGPVRSDDPTTSLYPGFSSGSETNWLLQEGTLASAFSIPILQNLVFNNLSYDAATFNWASDVDILDARAGTFIDETSNNLSSFWKRGSKMLVYQGWADPFNAAAWPIQHLEAVTRATIGDNATVVNNDFMKLFMIPGGGHCGASISAQYSNIPAEYDMVPALVNWVEKGHVPLEGIKSEAPSDGSARTRRLCAWPAVAKLKDGGEVDDWESYVCE
ncbi:Tannase/feruloyl esterase [Lophiotrema nucula]|uniref:Carboxylic ester hydrolase n=1 Tax=Lophiotrema nucula TaxID=690887 RepID=A0A6A5ZK65_9PLEO|nr:Tannase/feruloyl esterase [Lophiotrema nucula]